MLQKPTVTRQLILPAVLFVVTTIYLVAALGIRPQYDEGLVGPSFLPIVISVVMYLGLAAVATAHSESLEHLAEIGTAVLGVLVALLAVGVGVIVLVARFRAARRSDAQLAPVHTLPPRVAVTEPAKRTEEEAA